METTLPRKTNPFDRCPVYETERFRLRLVEQADAPDLFVCYSDPLTLSHVNNDNCSGEFRCESVQAMEEAIRGWRREFDDRSFIRWSVLEKADGKAVGSVEIAPIPYSRKFFSPEPPAGILRIDLGSAWEREELYREIVGLMSTEMAADFEVSVLLTKARPEESGRVAALLSQGFEADTRRLIPYEHYYIRSGPAL